MSKRAFPYYSELEDLTFKRPAILGGAKPDREAAAPRLFDGGVSLVALEVTAPADTDFTTWSDAAIKAFLDQRGEDFSPDIETHQLVSLAIQCEANTGPAVAPAGDDADTGGSDDYDPLDAFMAGVQREVVADKPTNRARPGLSLDETDHVADYMEQQEKRNRKAEITLQGGGHGGGGVDYDSDEDVYRTAAAVDAAEKARGINQGYDADGNEIAPVGKGGKIEPLKPVDHDAIEYEEFEKAFYKPAPDVAAMTESQVHEARRQLGIRISGFDVPRPINAFAQCGLDATILAAIRKAGYEAPTPIQAAALPAALSGRDVLGIAKTGSGKTASFVLPMLVHIMNQPELERGEGPIGIIVAPTRELAEQIHKECRRFGKGYGLRMCAAFGGLSKLDQFRDLKSGSEVMVCTPGRLIDLIKMKACTMIRTTYLVFDEADRMFDMGFEPQVRSIISQVRPDRQTLLFSATMPSKVEGLVRDALAAPVRITVGNTGAANADIKQTVEVLPNDGAKLPWLKLKLPEFIDAGDVLVFVNQKTKVEELTQSLVASGFRAAAIHGDMDQHSRMAVLSDFKGGAHHVLVATDVAARGLDIKSIKAVVNFDAAKDIDTHVHRIGRTGRAGDKEGVAYTLVTSTQVKVASDLVAMLGAAHQVVSEPLHTLALRDRRFKGRVKNNGGGSGSGAASGAPRGRRHAGGSGLGYGDAAPVPLNSAQAAAATSTPGVPRTVPQATTETEMGFAAASASEGYAAQYSEPPQGIVSGPATIKEPSVAKVARQKPGWMLPPPPPPPPPQQRQSPSALPAGVHVAEETMPLPAPPSAPRVGSGEAAPSTAQAPTQPQQFASTRQSATQPPLPQQQQQQMGPAAAGGYRTSIMQNMYGGKFRSSFQSSGTAHGDQHAKTTVILPKRASAAPLPPPPTPLSQVPIYIQRQQAGTYTPPADTQSPAAKAAIAAAQAIATRMASQGSARPLPAAPSPGAYNAATGTYNSMHQAPTHSSWLPMPPAAAPWTSDGASAASSGFISSGAFGSSGQAPQAASVAAAQMIAARLAAQGQTGGNQESSVATAEAFAARLAAKDGQNPHSSQRESLPTGSGRFAPPSSLYSNQVEDSYAASRNQGNQGGRPDGGPRGGGRGAAGGGGGGGGNQSAAQWQALMDGGTR